jgi:hypothetical protein
VFILEGAKVVFHEMGFPDHFLQLKGDSLALAGVKFSFDALSGFFLWHGFASLHVSMDVPGRRTFARGRPGWLSALFREAPQHGSDGGQLARIKLFYQCHKFLRGRRRERCDGLAGYLNDVRHPYVFYGIVNKKRSTERAGRPATGQDPVTAIRLSKELRDTVDNWAGKQDDTLGRSEAVRLLVEWG